MSAWTGSRSTRAIVEEPDPGWVAEYDAEAASIADALGDHLAHIHHIGSTAIGGICAKPVIDILLETRDAVALDAIVDGMRQLHYESVGEYGIARRRYFRKDDARGVRRFHVHAFMSGDPHVRRHLAFRDYMRAHPAAAAEYDALKRRLADAHRGDKAAYSLGKDAFVAAQEALALAWLDSRR
jgi:GrpB-like predicted nucleotidyltransferase (UPF0157 family)